MPAAKLTYVLRKVLCWVLLLQLVNISIDPPDIRSLAPVRGAATYNEIESVYELVSEDMFGADVPETDEEDIEKSCAPLLWFCSEAPVFLLRAPQARIEHRARYAAVFPLPLQEPNGPPPREA